MYISKMYVQSKRYLAVGWVVLFCLTSCHESDDIDSDESYTFIQPDLFPKATYTFENNPVTKEGFELGKKLFFDPLLSRDGSVACSNCHQQGTAFADSRQHALSIGVDNLEGTRNAPSLANLAFKKEFFWDGGVTHLDFVPLNAIESEVEMDEELSRVVEKLNANSEYPQLFSNAFGQEEVTMPYALYALSQFTVMMVSDRSRYDNYLRNEKEVLNAEELAGLALFENKCSDCHSGMLFSDFSYRNNGLDAVSLDSGRAKITETKLDLGKFRVPSLRNVALTAPYMHDARFQTLKEVLDHYDSGIKSSETLDPILTERMGISITEDEKTKIIAFLQTLTDREFISDSRFFNTTN